MIRVVCRIRRCLAIGLIQLTVGAAAARAGVVELRPVSDTFVVNPGSNPPHAKMLGIEDCDFGGAGSRAVAAATAYVADATSPNNRPHGLFRSLLRFDASELAGATIAATTLRLYTTREMTGGKDIFNPKSISGDFRLSLLALPAEWEWTQGYGGPETLTTTLTDSATGLTHDLLEALLARPEASLVDVGTLHFDATLLDPAAVQTWMSYDVESEVLDAALASGGIFSLLLSPANDSVSFNFSCRTQNGYPGDPPTIWANGPILEVLTSEALAAPEPTSFALFATAVTAVAFCGYRRRKGSSRPRSSSSSGGC
jgi:hypothetical protein